MANSHDPTVARIQGRKPTWFWCSEHGDYAIKPMCPQCEQDGKAFTSPSPAVGASLPVFERLKANGSPTDPDACVLWVESLVAKCEAMDELKAALLALKTLMEQKAEKLLSTNWRSGHYDEFGAGEEHRANHDADQIQEWAAHLGSLLEP